MYVCICNSVTDRDIKTAVKQGHDSYEKICSELKVASCCGRCQMHAREVIAEAREPASAKVQSLCHFPAVVATPA